MLIETCLLQSHEHRFGLKRLQRQTHVLQPVQFSSYLMLRRKKQTNESPARFFAKTLTIKQVWTSWVNRCEKHTNDTRFVHFLVVSTLDTQCFHHEVLSPRVCSLQRRHEKEFGKNIYWHPCHTPKY